MRILFFWLWESVIVTYYVWNKTPESIFQITWGQWGTQQICNGSMRRPFTRISHQGGKKNTRWGHSFQIQYWMYATTGSQLWNGVPDTTGPHWRRPWSVVKLTAALLVSFTVTVFAPDSAVATQICPQNAYRAPMVISKKYFDITAHPKAKWPSQQLTVIFCSFHFTMF